MVLAPQWRGPQLSAEGRLLVDSWCLSVWEDQLESLAGNVTRPLGWFEEDLEATLLQNSNEFSRVQPGFSFSKRGKKRKESMELSPLLTRRLLVTLS